MEKKRTTYISIRYPWTPPLPPPPPIGNLDEDSEKLQTTFVLPKIMNKKFNLKLHNEGPLEPVGDGSTWSPLHCCLPPARLPPQGPHQVWLWTERVTQFKILYLWDQLQSNQFSGTTKPWTRRGGSTSLLISSLSIHGWPQYQIDIWNGYCPMSISVDYRTRTIH